VPSTKSESNDPEDEIANLSGISPIQSPRPKNYACHKKRPGPKRRVIFQDKKEEKQKMRDDKTLRNQIVELEWRLKRQDSELAMNRVKINNMHTQIQEKDKHIRDLELRLPRVLADISRGVGSKEALTRKNNRDMRESLKRNHHLTQQVKDLEQKLSQRDEKDHMNKILKERLNTQLMEKDKKLKECSTDYTGYDVHSTFVGDGGIISKILYLLYST